MMKSVNIQIDEDVVAAELFVLRLPPAEKSIFVWVTIACGGNGEAEVRGSGFSTYYYELVASLRSARHFSSLSL